MDLRHIDDVDYRDFGHCGHDDILTLWHPAFGRHFILNEHTRTQA
jgi:hypothetical protein